MSKVVGVNVIKHRCEYNSNDTKISLHDLLSVTLDAILWFICEDWAGNHFVFPYHACIAHIPGTQDPKYASRLERCHRPSY